MFTLKIFDGEDKLWNEHHCTGDYDDVLLLVHALIEAIADITVTKVIIERVK